MSETNLKKGVFAEMEEEVLKFWGEADIFNKSVKKEAPQGDYVFYDGPPFATGTPHYGHLVGNIMKDSVPRFWTMNGYRVERKWGWDCHGLPIENIVEKEMGTKTKKEIESMGIDKFNDACRARVLGFVDDWRQVVERLGRWVDMDNAYRTMDLPYMESIWWVFKQLWDKGLIYEGYRSMHICPRCETTLSQSEVAEGYKDIKDLSATAKFKLLPGQKFASLESGDNTFVLAWTTTPWTLIANVALAVGTEIDYVATQVESEILILAKDLVDTVLAGKEYQVIKEFKGNDLVSLKYQPLYDAYAKNEQLANRENGWQIVSADFVTTTDGVGVVHIAPAFGEDDMNLGKEKNLPFVQHIGMDGIVKPEVGIFVGLSVKPSGDHTTTDIEIIKDLAGRGLLFSKAKYEHSYPHCWRCDTPLLNYATSSWFVRVTEIKPDALASAENIRWSPEHIKEGRFGQWLSGARDWSISRQRFWAGVLPIWRCSCGNMRCFGSVAELKEASGVEVQDLHKHVVDKVEFACDKCAGIMKRIPDVLDCWFESGSMPYAQHHYPFENGDKVEKNFPAEFIAEGVDQTRAWFYYMHVIANGLKAKHAFKNAIVNGIVLAEDGKKMSKKLKNYPDPTEVLVKYGADALRMYLLSSPVMQAENLNFSEKGVEESLRKNVMLLWNIYKFYETYASEVAPGEVTKPESKNVLDNWLFAKLEEVTLEVTRAMQAYNLPKAVRPLTEFIDEFSTWYLRRSRERLRESTEAVATMRYALAETAKLMAPFAPFIAERLWQKTSGFNFTNQDKSVHLLAWSNVKEEFSVSEKELLTDMDLARRIVEMGLAKRDEVKIKVRQPLQTLSVSGSGLSDDYLTIICDELNVKEVKQKTGSELAVELDVNITPILRAEGIERDLIRFINMLRKNAGLTIEDRVDIYHNAMQESVRSVLIGNSESIALATASNKIIDGLIPDDVMAREEVKVDDYKFVLAIKKIN